MEKTNKEIIEGLEEEIQEIKEVLTITRKNLIKKTKSESDLIAVCKAVFYDAINHQYTHDTKSFPKKADAIKRLVEVVNYNE